jgi:hypothetical protein
MLGPAAVPIEVSSVVRVIAGDPAASRVVYGTVGALFLIGVVLVVLAFWLVRQTRVDPELLAPLETMSDRKWRKLDPASQRRLLDDERPVGAQPLLMTPMQPAVDAEFEAGEMPVTSFDDLVPVAAVPLEDVDGADTSADDTIDLDREADDGSESGEDSAGETAEPETTVGDVGAVDGEETDSDESDEGEDPGGETAEAETAVGDVGAVDGEETDSDEPDEVGDETPDTEDHEGDSDEPDDGDGSADGDEGIAGQDDEPDEPDEPDVAEGSEDGQPDGASQVAVEAQAAEQQTVEG